MLLGFEEVVPILTEEEDLTLQHGDESLHLMRDEVDIHRTGPFPSTVRPRWPFFLGRWRLVNLVQEYSSMGDKPSYTTPVSGALGWGSPIGNLHPTPSAGCHRRGNRLDLSAS